MQIIIQDFLEKVTNFKDGKIELSNIADKIKIASRELALDVLKYILEFLDENIRNSEARKRSWYIERYDTRSIYTSLGKVTFTRTYYVSKHKKKKYAYLLDQALEINKYQRMDISVEAKLLEFANELSYEKAGFLFDENISFSKETVKNKVKKFGESVLPSLKPKEKKEVKYLYIDADEDHVSLQNGRSKINKLIYVYEDKLKESKNRNILLNKQVFASIAKESEDLWLEVLDYLEDNYNMEKIETIYIQGDGANWIKTGLSWIEKSIHVIDMFHLNKGIMRLAGGNLKEGNGLKLKSLIYKKDKINFLNFSKELLELEKDEKRYDRKKRAFSYIKNQWKGIELFINDKEKRKLGCSAEGHVSHILSSRMSSRPRGWTISGLENLTKLRVFKENSGSFEELKDILKCKNKKIALDRKERLKNIKRIKKKTGEMLGNIPVISTGKINGSYFAVKSFTIN